MRESILEFIRSPLSGHPLKLTVFETGSLGNVSGHILSGKLTCGEETYPIVQGVPRLLTGTLLTNAIKRYPEFLAKYGEHFPHLCLPAQNLASENLKEKTQESFGIQWNLFPKMFEEWRENFREYLAPHISLDEITGKTVLDCGCGFGRHLYQSAQCGARAAIGIDLSHAVDAAAVNVAAFANAHVVQGDIYNLPVTPQFDLAYCIGVLQHLPQPQEAFVSIASKVVYQGRVFAWIYGKRPLAYHLFVDSLRNATLKMNSKDLYRLSLVLAVASFGLLALPRRALTAMGLGAIGKLIPFSRYAEYPFQVSHADWYDRLAAPKTCYFSESEAWDMVKAANLNDAQVTFRDGGSYKLHGRTTTNAQGTRPAQQATL